MAFQSNVGFSTFGGDQSDNPLCQYYADQAVQHAQRFPHDHYAQAQAQYWLGQVAAQQLKLRGSCAPPAPAAPTTAPQPIPSGLPVPGNPWAMPGPMPDQTGAAAPSPAPSFNATGQSAFDHGSLERGRDAHSGWATPATRASTPLFDFHKRQMAREERRAHSARGRPRRERTNSRDNERSTNRRKRQRRIQSRQHRNNHRK